MGRLDISTEDSTSSAIHHWNTSIVKEYANSTPNWGWGRGNCEGMGVPDTFSQIGAWLCGSW